jgi:hypothetical protein
VTFDEMLDTVSAVLFGGIAVAGCFFLILVALSGCAPFASYAPVSSGNDMYCDTVRSWVAGGTLPVELAFQTYPECAPFEVPQS